jgi:hypothetical protein
MKCIKIFIIGIFMVAFSNAVVAQGFGIRGGANFATLTGGDIPDVGGITGFYAGVYYQMPLIKDFLYLQPELQYSGQGFSSTVSGTAKDYNMDYVTIPIMAKIYVIKIFSFEAGPQFGFNVSDSLENVSVESFDPAFALGFGINLPFGISIDTRYVQSFSEAIPDTDEKNQVFQVGLGFKF